MRFSHYFSREVAKGLLLGPLHLDSGEIDSSRLNFVHREK